jgi:hypothetical protein
MLPWMRPLHGPGDLRASVLLLLFCPVLPRPQRNLVALAWVRDRCDRVLESVGLYTSWAAAQEARRPTLKGRDLDGTTLWHGLGRESSVDP